MNQHDKPDNNTVLLLGLKTILQWALFIMYLTCGNDISMVRVFALNLIIYTTLAIILLVNIVVYYESYNEHPTNFNDIIGLRVHLQFEILGLIPLIAIMYMSAYVGEWVITISIGLPVLYHLITAYFMNQSNCEKNS